MVDVNIKGVLNGIAAVLPTFTSQSLDISSLLHPWPGSKLTQAVRFMAQQSGLFGI